MQSKSVLYSCVLAALLAVGSVAQQAPTADANVPVFRVQSKLVLVDVVVTDKNGAAVAGLKPTDFQVNESGKPQKIRFFEEHVTPRERPSMPAPKLPEGQYTNFPTDPPKSTMNILLFDLLNTSPSEQIYARKEMLKALEELPPGQQLALFVLGGRLQMIQGPSSDSNVLKAAAKELRAVQMHHVTDVPARNATDDIVESMEQQAGSGGYGSPKPLNQSLRAALLVESAAATDDRVSFTLASLEAIARMVSGYPGRKNLIWISGGIPFQIGPDMKVDKYHRWRERRDFQQLLERAGSLLADAQIAIYPVDLAGMSIQGVTAAVSSKSFGGTGREYYGAFHDQSDAEWDNRVASNALATETGGHAFYGSNDLAGSVKNAIQMGSQYYTIAYVPTNANWDGKYRTIDIKSPRSGLSLKYRKGYLALADKLPSEQDAIQTLASAVQLGMPASTTLLMRTQVVLPDKGRATVRIDTAVAADEVRFQDGQDRTRRATMDFLAVAWNSKGAVVEKKSNTVVTTIKPDTPESQLRTGIPDSQELELKPGKYLVCVGAMDRASQKIGTVWMKVIVPETK